MKYLFALVAAAVLAIAFTLPEDGLASAIHQSTPHGELTQSSAAEGEPSAAAEPKLRQEQAQSLEETVPGPGAFLGVLLKQLAAASAESDQGIKKLVAGLPQVFPDLNKVLVAL